MKEHDDLRVKLAAAEERLAATGRLLEHAESRLSAVTERDDLRAKLAAAEGLLGAADQQRIAVTDAAHRAGWNGTENPKAVWSFITSLATERDDLRTRLAAAEGEIESVWKTVGGYTGTQRPALAPTVASFVERLRDAEDLRTRLYAVTAPVEGEPTEAELYTAFDRAYAAAPNGYNVAAARKALYRLGVQHERARHQPTEPRATEEGRGK